jgi:hypothetical protein
MKNFLISLLVCLLPGSLWAKNLPLHELQLPPGFSIAIYADHLKDARGLTIGDKGTVFVGSTMLYSISTGYRTR